MPRKLHLVEPKVINDVVEVCDKSNLHKYIAYATTNERKLDEIRRILKGYQIESKKIEVEEAQSLDPIKVVSHKAKNAWRQNEYNPIIVEDTSLELYGLGGRPASYVKDFLGDIEMRRNVVEGWLKGKDRRAVARVLLAVYDGKEVQIREGKVSGKISETLKGSNGFGWDDIFIPDGQNTNSPMTFAQMSDKGKDKYSMRRLALEKLVKNPFNLNYPIFQLPEPYKQELLRVRKQDLQDKKARKFAYSLECFGGDIPQNSNFEAKQYRKIKRESNDFYNRFIVNENSKSLGLLLTDPGRHGIKTYANGDPLIWQMGPERRSLALAQRSDFFIHNQNKKILSSLSKMGEDTESFPRRRSRRSVVVERVLGYKEDNRATKTFALKEIGYKKISSKKEVSRTQIARNGLYSIIGKYPRSIFGIGSMPPVSGWRDVIVTAAIAHMPIFTTRNSIFAGDTNRQTELIKDAKRVIQNIGLDKVAQQSVERNIGAAIGSGNVSTEVKNAKLLYDKAGVRLFRIYTINSDPRVIETAKALRKEFGDSIEIFAGQISDKKQALSLISPEVNADCLIFGHGGGRQCTSATNGMAVTTLEEVYKIISDVRFDRTSLLVEGGVGSSVGPLLILGINGILYNQQFSKCSIETGDIFFEHRSGKICHPYHGSASAPTMIIESNNPKIRKKRMTSAGRVLNVEGKPGYTFYAEKANSMVFYIDRFRHYAARTLADLGVQNIAELTDLVNNSPDEYLRVVTTEAGHIASAYRNN